MFISNKEYKTPELNDAVCIRNILYTNFYTNSAAIDSIENIIKSVFSDSCKSVIFNKNVYGFFIHTNCNIDISDVCTLLYNVFVKFIKENELKVISCLRPNFDNPYELLNMIYNGNPFFTIYELLKLDNNTFLIKL